MERSSGETGHNSSLSRHQLGLLQAQVDSLQAQLSSQQQVLSSTREAKLQAEGRLKAAGSQTRLARQESHALKAKVSVSPSTLLKKVVTSSTVICQYWNNRLIY